MSAAFGGGPGATLMQVLSRRSCTLITVAILLAHLVVVIIGIVFAPKLFSAAQFHGSICQKTEQADPTWQENPASHGGCVPVETRGNRVPLDTIMMSFRFPRDEDEVSSYSRWNWRILANLMIDITFYGSKIPGNAWPIFQNASNHSENVDNATVPMYTIDQRDIPVRVKAKLDKARHHDENVTDGSDLIAPESSEWTRAAGIYAERDLECSLSKPLEDLVKSETMFRTAQYVCSLNPLLDLHLPDNNSYIVSLEVMPDLDSNETNLEYEGFFRNEADINAHVTMIVENRNFHRCVFYFKCIFTPFILIALAWFCIKLYLNDLYISIPDRMLFCSALTQLVHNVPTEVLVVHWSYPHLKFIDDFGYITLFCSLLLFWLIYALDKVAKNEPWERNTRFYWKEILLIILSCTVLSLFTVYDQGPAYKNPFNNHWISKVSASISLAFIFILLTLAMLYQLYFSVIVFRYLCDLSVSQQFLPGGTSFRTRRSFRLRLVMFYCYIMSMLTMAEFILRLASKLSLNWNQQFLVDPVPLELALSSPFVLALHGSWNIHIIVSLVLLSRHKGATLKADDQNYCNNNRSCDVRPVKYSRQSSQYLDKHDPDPDSFTETCHEDVVVANDEFHCSDPEDDDSDDEERSFLKLSSTGGRDPTLFTLDEEEAMVDDDFHPYEHEPHYEQIYPDEDEQLGRHQNEVYYYHEEPLVDPILSSSSSDQMYDEEGDEDSIISDDDDFYHPGAYRGFHRTQST